MNTSLTLLAILLLITPLLNGQKEKQTPETYPQYQLHDLYQLEDNQANFSGTLFLSKSYLRCSANNRFLLKELMTKEIGAIAIYHQNAIQLTLEHFGFREFGELKIGVGYGRLFGKKLAIGMQFQYLFNHAGRYPSVHSITFDISASYKINNRFCMGFSIYNPARLKRGISGKENPYLPLIFRVDFYYEMNKKFFLYSNIEKELCTYFRICCGGSYSIGKNISLLGGFCLPNPELYGGIRLMWKYIHLDARSSFDFKIGFSPSLSLLIPFSL